VVKSFNLAWIVVSDIKKARKFFIETLGLKEHIYTEEYGWAELSGQDGGTKIGLAQKSDKSEIEAGENAVITLTVANLEKTVAEFKKKNVNLVGEIIEVPGHVKLQLFTDQDGNKFQLVQTL
jgi:predicted enzyme related to lactoylglutathione lyase